MFLHKLDTEKKNEVSVNDKKRFLSAIKYLLLNNIFTQIMDEKSHSYILYYIVPFFDWNAYVHFYCSHTIIWNKNYINIGNLKRIEPKSSQYLSPRVSPRDNFSSPFKTPVEFKRTFAPSLAATKPSSACPTYHKPIIQMTVIISNHVLLN